jgi:Pentapeptide repeats (8 copies)
MSTSNDEKKQIEEQVQNKLAELRTAAIDEALKNRQVVDLEKAVSIAKTISDREKTESDHQNAPKMLRYESWKTLGTAIVPLLTLATLAFTVWTQNNQLHLSQQANRISQEANADATWRETAKNVLLQLNHTEQLGSGGARSGRPESASSSDPHLAIQLLTPYFSDKRHGAEALDIALLVLLRVRDPEVLADFLSSPSVQINADNVHLVLAKMRDLRAEFYYVNDGLQDKTIPPDDPIAHHYWALLDNLTILNDKVGDLLRSRETNRFRLDLRRTFFYNSNLSGANLDGAAIDGARFEKVDLSAATLTNMGDKTATSVWIASNWWDAKLIDPQLLKKLMNEYYPYPKGQTITYAKDPPDQATYLDKVKHLCQGAGILCTDSDITYGTKAKAKPRKAAGQAHQPRIIT